MEALSIRLSGMEVRALAKVLHDAREKCLSTPDIHKWMIKAETIMLAEFFPSWWKKLTALQFKPKGRKDPVYKIPASICKIVHYRLQHLPVSDANQLLLNNLDGALINVSLVKKQAKIN